MINYFSIDRFVKDNAREKLNEAYNDVVTQVDNFKNSDEEKFTLKPSEHLVNQGNNTQVYVFDSNYNEVSLFDNSIYIDKEMLSFLSSLLSDYELEEGTLTNITFNGKEYIANVYVTSNSLNIKEKYFVVIQELTGKSNLLRESSRQLLLIQFIVLVLVILTVYLVAKDLTKPIIKLSKESEEYVIGKGVTIGDKNISTTELESLRQSLINMQKKIDVETNRKNTIYENVAHDLRTPLVSILGYADGLKAGIIKDKNKACEVILRTGNQLKEMIENILVLSRFDNDTYKGNNEELSLVELISEQVETVKVIDESKKIIFKNELDDEGLVNSDRKLLIRIIQNLLSNGIKYAKSQVVIELKKAGSHSEPQYVIAVTDDGKGIDAKNIQNIFTRYYKGEDGHFGIGLAVVKSSADYLGYKVEVDSIEEKGTTFIITIFVDIIK
ncbi:MAG: HAMP domain-containing histidine kinase [Lachnospiraceae bacterium]|nr:HAMP domain-containing histidine kinase [Lachnospiraceae bacterium]